MNFLQSPTDPTWISKSRTVLNALPQIAPGLATHLSMHWAATPYGWALARAANGSVIPYNLITDVDQNGDVVIVNGMDPRRNARDIDPSETPDVDYCASCWHRNSHGLAVSISALYDGGPASFGAYPLTERLVDGMCAAAGALCAKYGVDASNPATCFTHAEAAIWDAYFWGDTTPDGDTRGDLCILEAHPEMSTAQLKANASVIGDQLRSRVRAYKLALLGEPVPA